MMNFLRKVCLVMAVALPMMATAKLVTVPDEYEERYHHLLTELRCLVCQNQNLADSNSDLAYDLRVEVKEMMLSGATDQQILDFMSARYGDFVLYRPPVSERTYLLWFGPFLLLLIGLFTVWMIARRTSRKVHPITLSDTEQQELKRLTTHQDDQRDD